ATLQWGRALIRAERPRQQLTLRHDPRLQWGRALIRAERTRLRCRRPFSSTASMGPRVDTRGKASAFRRANRRSMALQWGRALIRAERFQTGKSEVSKSALQWGR